jgi:hypothetical protein
MYLVYNCCWSSTAQSFSGLSPAGLMTTFYCIRFETPPTWRARSPYLFPSGRWWPSYTPRHWIPFSSPPTTLRATWRYSTPPPHGISVLCYESPHFIMIVTRGLKAGIVEPAETAVAREWPCKRHVTAGWRDDKGNATIKVSITTQVVQWLRLALLKTHQSHSLWMDRSSSRRVVFSSFFLEYRMIGKVQKPQYF